MTSLNNADTERMLLKQITDLTKQLETQKHLSNLSGTSRQFVRQANGNQVYRGKSAPLPAISRKWSKPASSANVLPVNRLQNHSNQAVSTLDGVGAASKCNSSVKGGVKSSNIFVNPKFVANVPAQSSSTVHVNPKKQILQYSSIHVNPKKHVLSPEKAHASHNKQVLSSSTVHLNPNKQVLSSTSVHVNPNFRPRGQTPASDGALPACSVSTTAARNIVAVADRINTVGSGVPSTEHCGMSSASKQAKALSIMTAPTSLAAANPTHAGEVSVMPGKSSSAMASSSSSSAAAPVVSPGGTSKRRRSRSLSSRYRLLTHRKLIRRLSAEKSPPAAAPHHNRHKLFRGVTSLKSKPPPRPATTGANRFTLVRTAASVSQGRDAPRQKPPRPAATGANRFKLVRTAASVPHGRETPRQKPTRAHQQSLKKFSHAGSHHRTLKRTQVALQRAAVKAGVVVSRHKAGDVLAPRPVTQHRVLRRTTSTASTAFNSRRKAVTISSSNRVWRRRNSSGSGQRLVSGGVVKRGSDRFVNIGGLLYKSTRRKLQRAAAPPAKPSSNVTPARRRASTAASAPRSITVRGTRYRIEAGGRSLRRLRSTDVTAEPVTSSDRLDIGGVTYRRAADGSLAADVKQQATKELLSRSKSRSLAVLRDSRRLSHKPCSLYCRTGRCLRHQRHQCPHVHRADLRPVCTRHLAPAGCQRQGCSYNHSPAPEKLPMCLHFLTDECRREPCPYPHVFVDPEAPLCAKFLAGYCPDGQKCPNKHLYICPEFMSGQPCPRGAACPLLHRARRRRSSRHLSPVAATPAPPRARGRYYLSAPVAADEPGEERRSDGEDGGVPRRRSMGEMPSFIRLGSSSDED